MAKITKVVENFTGDNDRRYSYSSLNLQGYINDNFYTKAEIDNKISNVNINNISTEQLIDLKEKLDTICLNNFLIDNDGNMLEDSNGQQIYE